MEIYLCEICSNKYANRLIFNHYDTHTVTIFIERQTVAYDKYKDFKMFTKFTHFK